MKLPVLLLLLSYAFAEAEADAEASPEADSSPQEGKRGSRNGGKRSVSYTDFESPKGKKKELFEPEESSAAEEPMEEEYEVEKILDVRKKGKGKEYLVPEGQGVRTLVGMVWGSAGFLRKMSKDKAHFETASPN